MAEILNENKKVFFVVINTKKANDIKLNYMLLQFRVIQWEMEYCITKPHLHVGETIAGLITLNDLGWTLQTAMNKARFQNKELLEVDLKFHCLPKSAT